MFVLYHGEVPSPRGQMFILSPTGCSKPKVFIDCIHRSIAFLPESKSHMANDRLRIVCISDTHSDDLTGKIPDGDIFLHAGDMTDDGTYNEMEQALNWIGKLPHKLKLVIPGR